MKKFINKLKSNAIISFIYKLFNTSLYIVVILLLIVIAVQRFSKNSISAFGFRMFTVASGSMTGEYDIGDIVIVKAVDKSELKVGDNVTYLGKKGSVKDLIVTHKIIHIGEKNGETMYTTKGIVNKVEDPSITFSQIYGKVVYRTIIFSFLGKLMMNQLTYYILFFVIAFIVSKEIVVNMFKNDIEEDEEKEIDKTKEINIIELQKAQQPIIIIDTDETIEIEPIKIEEPDQKQKNSFLSKLKKVKPRHYVILALLLIANTYAWFIYYETVSGAVDVHVKAWNVTFRDGDNVITTNVDVEVSEAYPGMEDYVKNITAYNYSDVVAEADFKLLEATLLSTTYVTIEGREETGETPLSSDLTSEQLKELLQTNYPFVINIGLSTPTMPANHGTLDFVITVNWDYESGNDTLDTYWGTQAYQFSQQYPDDPIITLKAKLIIKQYNEHEHEGEEPPLGE